MDERSDGESKNKTSDVQPTLGTNSVGTNTVARSRNSKGIDGYQDWIERVIDQFKNLLRRHLFTLVAVALVAMLLWRVSQVRNIVFQLPEDSVQRVGFLVTLLVIAGNAVISILGFVWPKVMQPKNKFTFYAFGCIALVTLDWLNALARSLRSIATGALGYMFPLALCTFSLLLLSRLSTDTSIWQPWLLSNGFARMMAVVGICIGVWLIFGRRLNPDMVTASDEHVQQSGQFDEIRRRQRAAWQVSGRVIAFSTLTIIAGELLWIAAIKGFPLASLRLYSVWAIIEIASLAVMACALIDFLDQKTHLPWRVFAVCGAAAVVWWAGPYRVDDAFAKNRLETAIANSATSTSEPVRQQETNTTPAAIMLTNFVSEPANNDRLHPWYADLETRLEKMPNGPAVFVAASGGGSRAAMFTAMVLSMLHQEPMRVTDLNQSSGSDPSSLSQGTWGEHIVAISCVSGGTLAAARYVQLAGKHDAQQGLPLYESPRELRYSDFKDLVTRGDDVFNDWIKKTEQSGRDPESIQQELGALRAAKAQLARIAEKYLVKSAGQPALESADDAFVEELLRSKFVDEMCIDFMAPILRGVLVPLEPRGQSLYRFWNDQFDWSNLSQTTWRSHWNPETQPMLLVNATDIDHGRRMIIGYPALPPRLLPPSGVLDGLQFNDTESSVREAEYSAYSYASVDPAGMNDITLGRAVRISSSFPFGFRPLSIAVPNPIIDRDNNIQNPGESKVLHYLDGGIVDNTGLDTFHALFQALAKEAREGNCHIATRILGKLRERGVIVFEIDSGSKPSRRSPASDPLRIITQPVGALSSASYTTALRTSDHYIQQVERILSDDPAAYLARTSFRDVDPDVLAKVGLPKNADRLDELLSGSLPVLLQAPTHPTCKSDRISCNTTQSDEQVMTAFALGPQGKARVIAQFLIQRDHWRKALSLMQDSYQQALAFRREFKKDSDSIELACGRLLDTLAEWLKKLDDDSSGDQPPSLEEKEERLQVANVLAVAAYEVAKSDESLQAQVVSSEEFKSLIRRLSDTKAESLFAYVRPNKIQIRTSVTPADPPKPTSRAAMINELKMARDVVIRSTEKAPGRAAKLDRGWRPRPDPFEQNKRMRQKSSRDFYFDK